MNYSRASARGVRGEPETESLSRTNLQQKSMTDLSNNTSQKGKKINIKIAQDATRVTLIQPNENPTN